MAQCFNVVTGVLEDSVIGHHIGDWTGGGGGGGGGGRRSNARRTEHTKKKTLVYIPQDLSHCFLYNFQDTKSITYY